MTTVQYRSCTACSLSGHSEAASAEARNGVPIFLDRSTVGNIFFASKLVTVPNTDAFAAQVFAARVLSVHSEAAMRKQGPHRGSYQDVGCELSGSMNAWAKFATGLSHSGACLPQLLSWWPPVVSTVRHRVEALPGIVCAVAQIAHRSQW